MPLRPIDVWPPETYKQAIRTETGGAIASTHLALIHPPGGKPCRAYVKHFIGPDVRRSLFNEWFSYQILDALGIPLPPCGLLHAPTFDGAASGLAFVSCKPSPVSMGTPQEQYRVEGEQYLRTLHARLLKCDAIPALLAADQLIANDDRNFGNFVFTGHKTFVAIDHSNALHGPNWSEGELLRTQGPVRSIVLDYLRTSGPVTREWSNSVLAAAEVIQERYYAHQVELRDQLKCAEVRESKLAMDMTWWRCGDLAKWVRSELGVL